MFLYIVNGFRIMPDNLINLLLNYDELSLNVFANIGYLTNLCNFIFIFFVHYKMSFR